MEPPPVSFIVGLIVLAYLSTFVLFALVRIITGISIQRIGFSGLRRITYTPKAGLKIEIRGLGISLRRPTFAQPTWVSIVITELQVTVDLKTLGGKSEEKGAASWKRWANGGDLKSPVSPDSPSSPFSSPTNDKMPGSNNSKAKIESARSRTWENLTKIKERIKRLHRKIHWLCMVDLVATSTSVVVLDVGSIQLGNLTMAVDTRQKTVDRSRLFRHRRPNSESGRPAEWIFTVRSILFIPEGGESTEILDTCSLNVHGLLYQHLDGLRDASIALKLGRLNIPYDDLMSSIHKARNCRIIHKRRDTVASDTEMSLLDVVEELDNPGSREESIVQTVSDSKEFASSILRGIQEVQFAVSFLGVTKRLRSSNRSSDPVFLNMSMTEVGLDVLRLDPNSPAHLTYFSPNDIAHQALLAAISISVGIDDGTDTADRLLYIPMATNTMRTTLPSKTIQLSKEKDVDERNTNILFSNLVITSPSLDLAPKHLPRILAMFESTDRVSPTPKPHSGRTLISRLLPKASIKLSIHEPVVRVTLPPMDESLKGTERFDLLISAMSSVSLDVESFHSDSAEMHYSVISNLRLASHQLYYQTATGDKHNLHFADSVDIKLQLSATPEIAVALSANIQTFSVYLVRPEISEGVRQIVMHMRSDNLRKRYRGNNDRQASFLRRLPQWLLHINLQGSDFNVEVAGIDPEVSEHARGCVLHLESWTAEYKTSKGEESEARPTRRRTSRTIQREDYLLRPTSPASSPRRQLSSVTDGRRLIINTQGLEGFVIESIDTCEPEPFLSLPHLEFAFATLSDSQGPLFNLTSFAKSLYVNYSLFRHFSLGVATMVLQRTFTRESTTPDDTELPNTLQSQRHLSVPGKKAVSNPVPVSKVEITTLDFKATFVQIKATMPSNPRIMMQIHELEAGRHRWANPYARLRLLRLYTETPKLHNVWSRISSVKGLRLDHRIARRKYGNAFVEEKSFDVTTDAIRLAVPHQLVVHRVFDNITNVAKVVEQLHHRFKTNSNDFVLDKSPEGPKRVPRVTLRSEAFLFEIEDGAFDWKLGLIYRLGLLEQKQRLAREEAFKLKVKKLEDMDRRTSRRRARSAHAPRGRSPYRKDDEIKTRSRSEYHSSPESSPEPRGRDHWMRYDTEGVSNLSNVSRRDADQAWAKLQRLNAQSWKKRIDYGLRAQTAGIQDLRSLFWGIDELPEDVMEQKETIVAIPQRPALMAVQVSDLAIIIDKPSFPLPDFASFLHKVGKGMPYNMKYSLLIPMNLQVNMGEAKVSLRDYPLPLIHVPAMRPGQSPRLPSLSMKTDFVIAEEYQNVESSRTVKIVVVPPDELEDGKKFGGCSINVRRTVSAVKTYSDMNIDINTANPTRITWGTSYQPAIQDMMQVIEGFTKPAVDPSERVGFWDKIRLTFHSRMNISWKGDGDVHLILKGSRDPYSVTGVGAGFVMCWRNDVRWCLGLDPDPRRFMTVNSGVYVLAIPDLAHYARQVSEASDSSSTNSSSTEHAQGALFKKTVMKLSGNVQWLGGLVFERNVDNGGRSFEFTPHYNVVLKNPRFAKAANGLEYDAFRGFRSHHIHLSLAIAAPVDRDWSVSNLKPSSNYNSVHLTPRVFSHFFSWWSMFSGVMALPIRQGKLWPGVEKSSKKFGRHLATIKYNLLLSPLYMSHIYKHRDTEDDGNGVVSATGLKARLDSFMLDLHQRREEFCTVVQAPQGNTGQNQTTGIRINQAQLDFIAADIRAVSASVPSTTKEDNLSDDLPGLSQHRNASVDLSRFEITDNDLSWIDMDDFVELDWVLPSDVNPETKILPLAFSPRFTYFRQTDHQENISGDPQRSSPFGNEPTHYCVMSARNDPRRVQCDLIKSRLEHISEQLVQCQRTTGEQELNIVRGVGDQEESQERLDQLRQHSQILFRKRAFLQSMYDGLIRRLEKNERRAVPDADNDEEEAFYEAREEYDPTDPDVRGMDSAPLSDYISDFNNRFIVHNVQLKWNNSLRNIILRYIHQVSQRRGFVYYMSRRAVKFILDIVEEQNKKSHPVPHPTPNPATSDNSPLTPHDDDAVSIKDRIQQLLNDGKKFVNANDPVEGEGVKSKENAGDVAGDYTPQNAYHVRLIAPQIQLQSEKNTKSAVLVTAKGMQLKVVQIMDKDRVTDDVSGLVQRRFSAAMDSLQIFVTSTKTFSTEYLQMYSGNRYGAVAGSCWPPWVPFEVMFEFETNPYGFSRVVQRTSASMRFDKYNTLRLKYNDDVTGTDAGQTQHPENVENRIDHIWVDFPHVRAICNSSQYYAMYIMVLDLLLYNEPLEKTRSERLEKIMLASDFSDLTGAPEMVMMLQDRIRQLEEIKLHFEINEKYLDLQGWKDRIAMENDLSTCEDELFFMMKAITTSQRRIEDRSQTAQTNGLLRWYISASQIVWHLLQDSSEPLAEFQLQNAIYDRTDNNDGSNLNSVEIEGVYGLNLLPNAFYPEMIAPYTDNNRSFSEGRDTKMVRVHWYMLEAIAGIPVMDHFEVNLFPLKVQLEREIGKRLFEYIFPGIGANGLENGGFSPFLVKHMLPAQEDDGEAGTPLNTPNVRSPDLRSGEADRTQEPVSLESRLQPTLMLPDIQPSSKTSNKSGSRSEPHHLRLFNQTDGSGTDLRRAIHSQRKDNASEIFHFSRPMTQRTQSNLSTISRASEADRKRFTMSRAGSSTKQRNTRTDDITEMMTRASNFMTLSYCKIPSVVLCLSYKGKGQRNFEDVHDLVFRMPTLEYRNKTWSNLDLALQLKRDIIRALISHAGAIVGNKFSHHRSSKQQQSRLRQIANSNSLLSSVGSPDPANVSGGSESNSIREGSEGEPRRSFTSGRSLNADTDSYSSSLYSGIGGSTAVDEGELFAEDLSRIDQTEPDRATIKSSLSRHLNSIGQKTKAAAKEIAADDSEESSLRKSKLLLGRKFLRSMS